MSPFVKKDWQRMHCKEFINPLQISPLNQVSVALCRIHNLLTVLSPKGKNEGGEEDGFSNT